MEAPRRTTVSIAATLVAAAVSLLAAARGGLYDVRSRHSLAPDAIADNPHQRRLGGHGSALRRLRWYRVDTETLRVPTTI
jgi:hypothetical protein